MVQRSEYEPRLNTGSLEENILSKRMSRRNFLGLTAAAGASVVLAGCGESRLSVDASNSKKEPESADANIDDKTSVRGVTEGFPRVKEGRYNDSPWADPEQYIDISVDELREVGEIGVDDYTRTDEGLADVIEQRLNTLLNITRLEQHLIRAKSMGYPDTQEGFGDYSLDNFIKPMLRGGVMSDTIKDKSGDVHNVPGPIGALESQLVWFAMQYKNVSKSIDRGDLFSAEMIANDVPSFTIDDISHLPASRFDRGFSYSYTMKGWAGAATTFQGLLNIVVNEDSSGKFIITPQRFSRVLQV